MNLVTLGQFHNRLVAFQGIQGNLGLENRGMIPAGVDVSAIMYQRCQ
jgi:hypothetical protein